MIPLALTAANLAAPISQVEVSKGPDVKEEEIEYWFKSARARPDTHASHRANTNVYVCMRMHGCRALTAGFRAVVPSALFRSHAGEDDDALR